MNKSITRVSSFILTIFVLLLIMQGISTQQQAYPFDTEYTFTLDFPPTGVNKSVIVDELNQIATDNNAILIKEVINDSDFKGKTDIVYFGSEPSSQNMVMDGNEIKWLDSKLSGTLIPSSEIGNKPLYGKYATNGDDNFIRALDKWAKDNDFNLQSDISKPHSTPALIYTYLIQSSIGNTIIVSFILYVLSVVAWFISKGKGRNIRYLGGISRTKIHGEDIFEILLLTIQGIISSLLVLVITISIINDIQQIKLIGSLLVKAVVVLTIISLLTCLTLSIFFKPTITQLAKRTVPIKHYKKINNGFKMLSIFIAVLIIPTAITTVIILQSLGQEYALWNNMAGDVRVNFGDIDQIYNNNQVADADTLLKQVTSESRISLSIVLDTEVGIPKRALGNYDHFILTDKTWLEQMKIGVNEDKENGMLTPIELTDMSPEQQQFFTDGMPLWTKSGKVTQPGINYYQFSGDTFWGLGQNVGYGGSLVKAKNPLVIVASDIITDLNTGGFVLPLMSTGNVIFSDEQVLKTALATSPIGKYINSVETVADTALGQAKAFFQEAFYYTLSLILILVAISYLAVLSARIWVVENKKRIFTLHSYGQPYFQIVKKPYTSELILLLVTIIVSVLISFIIRQSSLGAIIFTIIILFLVLSIVSLLAYYKCSKQIFIKVVARKE